MVTPRLDQDPKFISQGRDRLNGMDLDDDLVNSKTYDPIDQHYLIELKQQDTTDQESDFDKQQDSQHQEIQERTRFLKVHSNVPSQTKKGHKNLKSQINFQQNQFTIVNDSQTI